MFELIFIITLGLVITIIGKSVAWIVNKGPKALKYWWGNRRRRSKPQKEKAVRREKPEKQPTREQLIAELNKLYQLQLGIIDGSHMDATEKEMAREHHKQRYIKRLDELMR